MTDPWVCLECGARQAEQGACRRCNKDDTLDLRDDKVRELMRDVEQRLADQREKRLRFLGVGVGMAVVFGLWLVPQYWTFRRVFALPLLFDQWVVMALLGFGTMKLLGRRAKKRFPFLRDDLTVH
jgi:ribosomal protein L40E